jgi:arginine repressor
MAYSKKVSRSTVIRQYLDQHPQAGAKEVVEALAKQGTQVTVGLVYNVKGRLTQIKVHQKQKAKRVAQASEKTGSSDPVALIVKVKALAKEAGGMENLKALVSVLAD